MKYIRFLIAALGAVVIGYWIHQIGLDSIVVYLRKLNWKFVFILLNALGWYVLYTLAWETYFSPEQIKNRLFGKLLRVKIIGEAINLITPLGFMAGDPVRMAYTKRLVPGTTGCGSIIVDRSIHLLATLLVLCIGMIAFFAKISSVPIAVRIACWIVFGGSVLGILFLIYSQREGHLAQKLSWLTTIRWVERRFPRLHDQLQAIDRSTNAYFAYRPAAFWQSLVYHLGGRILGITEIGLILYFLTGQFDIIFALILAVLTTMVNFIFSFVPGSVGVLESMYGIVFVLFHADPGLGLSVQIIRRMRALCWITVGMIIMHHRVPTLRYARESG